MTDWNERIGEQSQVFAVGALFLVAAFLVCWQIEVHNGSLISESAPGQLAEVLFTSQASVLAIVFSLTYVGVQLTSPQYSPRLTWLFTENSHLQQTLIVVSVSLGLDAVVVTGTDVIPETYRLATAASIAVLGAVSFIAIAEYAIRSLTLATPAGIIAAYESRITGKRYLKDVRNTRKSRRVGENPLRGFHEFLCSRIDDGSDLSWSSGVKVMMTNIDDITRTVLTDNLREPSRTQTIDRSQTDNLPLTQPVDDSSQEEADDAAQIECNSELVDLVDETGLSGEELLHPPLVEFIPALVHKADESEATEEAQACLRQLKSTHKLGLKYGSADAVQLSHAGFRAVLDEDVTISTEVELTAWYFALVELRETVKIESEDHYRYLTEELESYRNVLEKDNNAEFYTEYSVLKAATVITSRILTEAIKASSGDINAEIRDLWNLDLDSYSARTALIVAAFRTLCSLTELAVPDTDGGKSHVSPTFLRLTWEDVARSASRHEERLAVPFYRGLIETGFVISVTVDGDESQSQLESWEKTISQAHTESPGAVEEAFSRVYPQTGAGRRRTATLPQPLLRLPAFKPIREHQAADRILPEFDPTEDSQEPQPVR